MTYACPDCTVAGPMKFPRLSHRGDDDNNHMTMMHDWTLAVKDPLGWQHSDLSTRSSTPHLVLNTTPTHPSLPPMRPSCFSTPLPRTHPSFHPHTKKVAQSAESQRQTKP